MTGLRRARHAGPVLLIVAGGAALLVPGEALAQGCAMCATYLSAGDPRTEAFKTSILFLMVMPFAVVASVGGWIAWMYRRHRVRQPTLHIATAEGEELS